MMKHPITSTKIMPAILTAKSNPLRHLLLTILVIGLILACAYAGYRLSLSAGIHTLIEDGDRQLELHARALESEIDIYTYLPSLLELESSAERLLLSPSEYWRQRVNQYLDGLNQRSGSLAIYLLDANGRVQAASNWRNADSYQGEDLAFRPYFQQAMQGLPGRFYGIGTTSGESGYYLAHGLRHRGNIIGVAAVKVSLESLEQRWERAHLNAFVSDDNGIIILSSNPTYRLKSLKPLDDETRTRLAGSLQYHWTRLDELQPLKREPLQDGVELVTLSTPSGQRQVYLAQRRDLDNLHWQFHLLTPLNDVRREAMTQGLLFAGGFALLAFLLIAWNERRKVIMTRLAAREALERANNELERKITERTSDLRASNERLRAEILERQQAEQTLRQAQDELVQAGKLAVVGQMSTSIAHELNQPLAALRTLSGNSIRFLQRGAPDTAISNLQRISDLVDHMGKITASLRAFARREGDSGEAWLVRAVDSALLLLHPRLKRTRMQIHREFDDVRLAIEQVRLEQILVNMISNALDAMSEQPNRQLWLTGSKDAGAYHLEIRDNGPGIDPDIRHHLFEPFFTTKPGEQGLGLGLTLSASMAAAAGGSLSVRHPAEGGTAFVLVLPLHRGSDHV